MAHFDKQSTVEKTAETSRVRFRRKGSVENPLGFKDIIGDLAKLNFQWKNCISNHGKRIGLLKESKG